MEETLDGRGTFHVTQMVAFQPGPSCKDRAEETTIGRSKSLKNIPTDFHKLFTVPKVAEQALSKFLTDVIYDKFTTTSNVSHQYRMKDLAWLYSRMTKGGDQSLPSWTGWNQMLSDGLMPVTVICYLPIIPAPAHEIDTIMTVLIQCKEIARKLNQATTVVTFDEALYCKARQLVWAHPDLLSNIVLRLGGFHTAMNFLGAIGKHMANSGLTDVWIGAGIYTEHTADKILSGKSWNRAVRAHKLTLEALWWILMKVFQAWQEDQNKQSCKQLFDCASRIAECFSNNNMKERQEAVRDFVCNAEALQSDFDIFVAEHTDDPTFIFWKQYMDLVKLLLLFLRAEREGIWNLHLETLSQMLPLMAVYDHTNYMRWGVVYLTDMQELETTAPTVFDQFQHGNFTVKETEGNFNQLATDFALEHINKLCKVAGGIVGITRTKSALDRWMLTCTELARMVNAIHSQVETSSNTMAYVSKDQEKTRIKRDKGDVGKIRNLFERFQPFIRGGTSLVCISTNDIASERIQSDLLSATERGQTLLSEFVESHLGVAAIKQLSDPIEKTNSKTFASLYDVEIKTSMGKTKNITADRDLLRRLLSASASGRTLNFSSILKYELSCMPRSLATTDGQLRISDKAALSHILADGYESRNIPTDDKTTCVLVDGMNVVHAIGKPTSCSTFEDLSVIFCQSILSCFKEPCIRVDVVFDTYHTYTIKSGTRDRQITGKRKSHRLVGDGTTKLPSSWQNFISVDENKVDLIRYLTKELLSQASELPSDRELVVASGNIDPKTVVSSCRDDLSHLQSNQEEADTRLILHAKEAAIAGFIRIVVKCKDTDVLVLFIYHEVAAEVWMDAGTVIKPRFISIHLICESLKPEI